MTREEQLSSKPVFEGKIVGLRIDQVRLAKGRVAVREVVNHKPAAVIVPLDDYGNVILVKQYRYAVGEALLEAPAGIIEDGEQPCDAAQRELREEVGLASGDLRKLGEFWMAPGFCNELMHAYEARDLKTSKLPADDDEDIRVVRVPLVQALDMIAAGEIRDAKTIAALLMAHRRSCAQDTR